MTDPPPEDAPSLRRRPVSWLLVGLVRLYQMTLSPWVGGHCRFYPSCSQYFIEAVRRHGPVRGSARGLARLARCHPCSRGGYDPVK